MTLRADYDISLTVRRAGDGTSYNFTGTVTGPVATTMLTLVTEEMLQDTDISLTLTSRKPALISLPEKAAE